MAPQAPALHLKGYFQKILSSESCPRCRYLPSPELSWLCANVFDDQLLPCTCLHRAGGAFRQLTIRGVKAFAQLNLPNFNASQLAHVVAGWSGLLKPPSPRPYFVPIRKPRASAAAAAALLGYRRSASDTNPSIFNREHEAFMLSESWASMYAPYTGAPSEPCLLPFLIFRFDDQYLYKVDGVDTSEAPSRWNSRILCHPLEFLHGQVVNALRIRGRDTTEHDALRSNNLVFSYTVTQREIYLYRHQVTDNRIRTFFVESYILGRDSENDFWPSFKGILAWAEGPRAWAIKKAISALLALRADALAKMAIPALIATESQPSENEKKRKREEDSDSDHASSGERSRRSSAPEPTKRVKEE